jgi:hypothetical protein
VRKPRLAFSDAGAKKGCLSAQPAVQDRCFVEQPACSFDALLGRAPAQGGLCAQCDADLVEQRLVEFGLRGSCGL